MAESNFHHRHKPGVRQRHNTALEHKIVRNVILRPPKAPEPEPEPELSTPVVVVPPVTEENKKRANQRTKKRREERKRQKARKEEAEIVANYTQDAGFTLGETLLSSLLKNGDS